MRKILILNGPPKSGKDFAAELMVRVLSEDTVLHFKLASPLKTMAEIIAGIPSSELERIKDTILPPFGISYRDIQINIFYGLAKHFGDDWLGKVLVNRINETDSDTIIISDGGRTIEVNPLIKAFGAKNISILQVFRDRCTFDYDIREYINDPRLKRYMLFNDGTSNFNIKVIDAMWDFLKGGEAV